MVMTYPFSLFGNFNAQVSVYAGDGSVSITHAGIEMGQGINTKVPNRLRLSVIPFVTFRYLSR